MSRITDKYTDGTPFITNSALQTMGMDGIAKKIAEYENAEENKLLMKLPCAIGADIYYVPSKVNFDLNILNNHKENNKVYHQNVENITFTKNGWYLECDKDIEYGTGGICIDKMYNVTWFLSPEKAEQKLKELAD